MIRTALLAICLSVAMAPAAAETLEEAVSRSLVSFPEVRSALASRRAVGETLDQARAQRLPSIDVSLGYGHERSENSVTRIGGGSVPLDRSEAEISLSQLLYDGGAVSNQVRRQQALTERATGQLSTVAESVALRAAQAYLEVLRLRDLLAIARENTAAHDRTLQQVTIIVESGAGRRADARQASARLAQAQAALAGLQGQLDQAEATYRHVTGRLPDMLLRPVLPEHLLPRSLNQAIEEAVSRHPSVQAALNDVRASEAELEIARSRMHPRLTLELAATRNRDIDGIRGPNNDQTAMLRLRQNLYRGGADAARIREAEARREDAQALLARAQNDVERDTRLAWENLASERERLPQLRLHARAAAEVGEAYRAQFKIGQRSLLDVLNAENEVFGARSNEVSGEQAVAAAVYRVLAAMGRLLPALGIESPAARASTGSPQS